MKLDFAVIGVIVFLLLLFLISIFGGLSLNDKLNKVNELLGEKDNINKSIGFLEYEQPSFQVVLKSDDYNSLWTVDYSNGVKEEKFTGWYCSEEKPVKKQINEFKFKPSNELEVKDYNLDLISAGEPDTTGKVCFSKSFDLVLETDKGWLFSQRIHYLTHSLNWNNTYWISKEIHYLNSEKGTELCYWEFELKEKVKKK